MRSFSLTMILLAGIATGASAQGSRLTAPITKAREAASAINARTAAQTEGQDPAPKRDSASAPVTSASAPGAQQPGSKRPTLPPAGSAGASSARQPSPAPVKAESSTASAPKSVASKTVASKTPGTKPADTSKATSSKPADSAKSAPAGNPATGTAATSATDRNGASATNAQAIPGKATTNGKAPAGKTPAAPAEKTPAEKPLPVTPDSAKPSATVETARTGSATTSVSSAPSNRPEIAINREVFQYDAAGRRDPFVSLLSTSDLRPLFSDLLLVVINYDPQGRNSVAIMRDAATKEQYRVRQGQLIGRMRVAAIEPKRVTFTIDEFGFSRQESLVIGDTTKVRKQ
jgi:hypothetical protein